MPPVFGPWSPSKTVLWSWAAASGGAGGVVEGREARRRDRVARHQVLRERLRALDRGRLGDRTEHREARVEEAIGEAGDERRLRPHHGEVDPLAPSERDETVERVGGEGDAHRVAGDAGVAGCREQRRDARALGDLPGERVLAAAPADDQHPHWSGARAAAAFGGWPATGATRLRSVTPLFIPTARAAAAFRGWPATGATRLPSVTPLFIPTARRATGSRGAARPARGRPARARPRGCPRPPRGRAGPVAPASR